MNNDKDDAALWLSLAFMICVTPLFVVSISYIFMLKEARHQCRRIAPGENYLNHNNRRVRIVKNYKAIKTVVSAINPLIYYFRNKEFRLAFCRTFRWLR